MRREILIAAGSMFSGELVHCVFPARHRRTPTGPLRRKDHTRLRNRYDQQHWQGRRRHRRRRRHHHRTCERCRNSASHAPFETPDSLPGWPRPSCGQSKHRRRCRLEPIVAGLCCYCCCLLLWSRDVIESQRRGSLCLLVESLFVLLLLMRLLLKLAPTTMTITTTTTETKTTMMMMMNENIANLKLDSDLCPLLLLFS